MMSESTVLLGSASQLVSVAHPGWLDLFDRFVCPLVVRPLSALLVLHFAKSTEKFPEL